MDSTTELVYCANFFLKSFGFDDSVSKTSVPKLLAEDIGENLVDILSFSKPAQEFIPKLLDSGKDKYIKTILTDYADTAYVNKNYFKVVAESESFDNNLFNQLNNKSLIELQKGLSTENIRFIFDEKLEKYLLLEK